MTSEAGVFPHEDWMTKLYDRIKNQKLGDIIIPGTHDSGSFLPLVPTAQTQDRDLGQQLQAGIRYFDIRVLWSDGRIPFKMDTFYLVHTRSTAVGMELEPQLRKIAEFATAHPREIIILDVTHPVTFEERIDMDRAQKARLVDLLVNTLPRNFRYEDHRRDSGVREIKVREPIEAGQNIIVLSDLEENSDYLRRRFFWSESDCWGSWSVTQYISDLQWFVERRLQQMGFREKLTELLLQRREEARGLRALADTRVDLSEKLLKLEFGFSTLTILTSAPDVNKAAVGWMKDWELGVGGPGPSGRATTTRGQINVVAVDYYNRVSDTNDANMFVRTVIELNQKRFAVRLPVWRDLGRLASGISSRPAVGRIQNGQPEFFAVGKDGKMWTNWQEAAGPWRGWVELMKDAPQKPTLRGANGSNRIAVGPSMDGRLELFASGSDGTIWHTWQIEINDAWSRDWETRGNGPIFASDIAVGKSKNGLLDLFVIRADDSSIYHVFQTFTADGKGVVWHDTWEPLGKPPKGAERLAVNQDSKGRLEVIALSDSQLYRVRQTEPNSHAWYLGWIELGPTEHDISGKVVNVGRNQDGRLQAFAWRGKDLWHTWQRGDNKDWDKTWEKLGHPPEDPAGGGLFFEGIAVGNYEDGRLVAFALDNGTRLCRISQAFRNGRWGKWELVSPDQSPGLPLQFVRTNDEVPVLFTWDEGSVLWGHEV